MTDFYRPDYASNSNDPFARDSDGTLVRRGFWLDMTDKSLVLAMTVGVGSHLSNEQKRVHLNDLGRNHLIDEICLQEILPPEA